MMAQELPLLPYELLAEIAWNDRRVYIALSSTCRRLRNELSLIRAIDTKRFSRRYVNYWHDSAMIYDRWWVSTDHVGVTVTYWIFERLIEFLYPDNSTIVIQYKWKDDDTRVGSMRKVTKMGPIAIRDIQHTYEPLTPCTEFESVVNAALDHHDLVINDYYQGYHVCDINLNIYRQ